MVQALNRIRRLGEKTHFLPEKTAPEGPQK